MLTIAMNLIVELSRRPESFWTRPMYALSSSLGTAVQHTFNPVRQDGFEPVYTYPEHTKNGSVSTNSPPDVRTDSLGINAVPSIIEEIDNRCQIVNYSHSTVSRKKRRSVAVLNFLAMWVFFRPQQMAFTMGGCFA